MGTSKLSGKHNEITSCNGLASHLGEVAILLAASGKAPAVVGHQVWDTTPLVFLYIRKVSYLTMGSSINSIIHRTNKHDTRY